MQDEDRLMAGAIEAMTRAYAPYSKFPVGAAILDETGNIHIGANVENAAYPVGNCAEASAIAAMVIAGGRRITMIAVAGGDGELLCTPCGACRQRIREFSEAGTPVLVGGPDGFQKRFTLGELLPASFGPENLTDQGLTD
ncbi:MAG: cytidine deaminase [Candidatus Puniceispirillaceae bacterium]|jgi:cytidine deaminase